ncbi:hypothetical protein AARAC_002767 [Aspergillus arachidicola]|uniref:CENP-V/GFA domain-containing protein n=1 Tax=Aspergillus arachidicola TaxID=656916 RepID=A0A2G7FXN5_9EURO|nr:hypothetical protein AARAC_002767 [Aspergillus arachidicola]
MAETKSYAGSCHCGQVKYSFSLSPPIEEQEVVQCNCRLIALLPSRSRIISVGIVGLVFMREVRTVPGVNIESLKIKKMDGKSVKFEKQS